MMSGIKGLKYDSGAAKRKRKKVEESIVKSQKRALHKHFIRSDVPAFSSSSMSAPWWATGDRGRQISVCKH